MSAIIPNGPSPKSSPSDHEIQALEELELSDDPSDKFEDVPTTPLSPPHTSPLRTPSKVKAAAAMWENTNPIHDTPKARKSSVSSSFRSIPASSSVSSVPITSPDNLTVEQSGGKSEYLVLESPGSSRYVELSEELEEEGDTPTSAEFADVPLTTNRGSPKVASSSTERPDKTSYSLSPLPRTPMEVATTPPEPIATPPIPTPSTAPVRSFFSSLGFPSISTAPPTETDNPASAAISSSMPMTTTPGGPSRSASSSSTGVAGGTWKTMTNLLTRTTPTPTPAPTLPSPLQTPQSSFPNALSPQNTSTASSSTSFLLHQISSQPASRDRRISRQSGGVDKLREGFERVRGEMEGAAREMRRQNQSKDVADVGRDEGEGNETGRREGEDGGERSGGVDWAFWGAVVQDYEEVARTRPKELGKAIQMGIPPVIRGAIWQLMSSSKSQPLEETYKALLKLPSPHEKAIAKDLSRTFPNHEFFKEGGGVGQESLFMVVKAYSLYDQEVGYTQGLAFIVAALLLNMPDEEAFCVLVRLMDSYNLRSHFLADMPGLQLRLFQFDRLVEEILPLIHMHFLRKGIKSSMFASQWFMTLFSYRFPLSLVYRVLDIVFAEGIEAIFRFSLALLHKSEDRLLNLEFEGILSFLQADLFEVYRDGDEDGGMAGGGGGREVGSPGFTGGEDGGWKAEEFVRDAYEVRITPFMLDSYESEWEEQIRSANKHAVELDGLRNANRNLSSQVKQLEASLATINQEHVELVRQLVMSKIDKEETENELVRYKMLYAELAHAQQDAMSTHSRLSGGSIQSGR